MSWKGRNDLALSTTTFFRLVGLALPCGGGCFGVCRLTTGMAAPGLASGGCFGVCMCMTCAGCLGVCMATTGLVFAYGSGTCCPCLAVCALNTLAACDVVGRGPYATA